MLEQRELLAAFAPTDIVVERVGDGVSGLDPSGNAVFLDEFTPTGTFVQSIAIPTSSGGANNPLIASGTSVSEGLLTRSVKGKYLFLTGFDAIPGANANLPASTSAAVPRTVGRVDVNGNIDTSTALADFASGSDPRSVVSTEGTNVWAAPAVSASIRDWAPRRPPI